MTFDWRARRRDELAAQAAADEARRAGGSATSHVSTPRVLVGALPVEPTDPRVPAKAGQLAERIGAVDGARVALTYACALLPSGRVLQSVALRWRYRAMAGWLVWHNGKPGGGELAVVALDETGERLRFIGLPVRVTYTRIKDMVDAWAVDRPKGRVRYVVAATRSES